MILRTSIRYNPHIKVIAEHYFKDHYDVTITSELGRFTGEVEWLCVVFNDPADCTAYTLKYGCHNTITLDQMRKMCFNR